MSIKKIIYLFCPPIVYNILKKYINAIKTKNFLKKINSNVVLNGAFKGMKYIHSSVGSTLLPKLIGSYEFELNEVMENFKKINFNNIVDIGSAEGYYAVGFALNFNYNKIFAFDISKNARKLLKILSQINNVTDKISIQSRCDSNILTNIDLTNSLILSDCEGYEKELFLNKDVFNKLESSYIIIEAHDFIDPLITIDLISLYSITHNIQIIQSNDDLNKAMNYKFFDTNLFSFKERYYMYKEERPSIMNWLILYPKKLYNQ